MPDQAVGLKHGAYLAPSDQRFLALAEVADALAAKENLSSGWPVEAAKQAKQGGLPTLLDPITATNSPCSTAISTPRHRITFPNQPFYCRA